MSVERWSNPLKRLIDRHYPTPRIKRDVDWQRNHNECVEIAKTIPTDPHEFYTDFGLLMNADPKKFGEPIKRLASYQYGVWKDAERYRFRLVVKSQKIGFTTSSLMEDLQDAFLRCRGLDILVVAQNQEFANDHIRTAKYMLLNSQKYRRFMMQAADMPFKEEKTKVKMLFLRNPDNPFKPTRMIGLGATQAGLWTWKNVWKIHMSDVAAITRKDDSGVFSAAFSRLAQTNGRILIESPPRGQRGRVYTIWKESKAKKPQNRSPEGQFKVYEIPLERAVDAGVVSPNFIEEQRQLCTPLEYAQNYECEFLAAGSTWYPDDLIETEKQDDITW